MSGIAAFFSGVTLLLVGDSAEEQCQGFEFGIVELRNKISGGLDPGIRILGLDDRHDSVRLLL